MAAIAAALLTPAAAMAFGLGAWRLCSDLKWAGEFAISRGIFSHWQVWIAMAGVIELCASILNRFGRQRPIEEKAEPYTPSDSSRRPTHIAAD